MHYSDDEIIEGLKQGNQKVLKSLFDAYYQELVIYSISFVSKVEIAEEIIQDLFIRIWENRKTIIITKSFKAYLFTAVRNRSLNYLKSKYARIPFLELVHVQNKAVRFTGEDELLLEELKKAIQYAVNSLPSKCKIIFNLSRAANLSHEEIAEELGISTKTVQTQIRIAIEKIKKHLDNTWDQIPY